MEKKGEHREPPLPEWCLKPTQGVCRWCGHLIWKNADTVNTRRLWHPRETGCLADYFVATSPNSARAAVWKRDKGKCAKCQKTVTEWQTDHVIRLVDCPREIKYWLLGNLQTLCLKCHTDKTVEENKHNERKQS